ncbi:MAG: hypothetical protein AAFN74_07105 [Myxococcota bacterium]
MDVTAQDTNTPSFELLGQTVSSAVEKIPDVRVRARVFRTIVLCDEALKVVDELDLSNYEITDLDIGHDLSTWNSVAPQVSQVLAVVRRAGRILKDLFPSTPQNTVDEPGTEDLESALQGMDETQSDDDSTDEIDPNAYRGADFRTTYNGVYQLATMLHEDVLSFGQRLRNPDVVGDRWLLLAELHELKSKCGQCLEAVVATVVRPFTDVALEAMLPRYIEASSKAAVLREQLMLLALEVSKLNDQLRDIDKNQAVALRKALFDQVSIFIEHPSYRDLRPADKRELARFCETLQNWSPTDDSLEELKSLAEGFTRFIEVLGSLNAP